MGLTPPAGDSANVGVTVGTAASMTRIYEELKRRGIMLPYVRSYAGTSPEGILRFAVFANHAEEHIDRLLSELGRLL